MLRRDGERLVPLLRRTRLVVSKLAVPLAFDPPEAFTVFRPGRWSLEPEEVRGREQIEGSMSPWLRNDLRISGLNGNRLEITVGRGPARVDGGGFSR